MSLFFKDVEKRDTSNISDAKFFHQHSCRVCPLNNLANKNPHLEPNGSKNPLVYILNDYPSASDDNQGEHLTGDEGALVESFIPEQYFDKIRFNAIVRTKPIKPIAFREIESCRPSIIRDIIETKPKAIVGLGYSVLSWLTGHSNISAYRGRRAIVTVGDHTCYYYPVLHPREILNKKHEHFGDDIFSHITKFDFKRVFDEIDTLPPACAVDLKTIYNGVEIFYGKKHDDLDRVIKFFDDNEQTKSAIGFDIETNGLRPYKDGSIILSMAFSLDDKTIAFGLNHKECKWTPDQKRKLNGRIKQFFHKRTNVMICHNVQFEEEWMAYFFGDKILRTGHWADTQIQAYCLTLGTKILKRSLDWVNIEDLKEGDELVGFPETYTNPSTGKTNFQRPSKIMHPTKVEKIKAQKAPCYKITTNQGEVICSENHMWATSNDSYQQGRATWIKTKDLIKDHHKLCLFAKPWPKDDSFEAGYISGLYDGEGHIHQWENSNSFDICFTQKRGKVLDKFLKIMEEKGYSMRVSEHKTSKGVVIVHPNANQTHQCLRIIGQFKPTRLIDENSDKFWTGLRRNELCDIISIEYVGIQNVIGIETTSKTLVANGFLSHNCLDERYSSEVLKLDTLCQFKLGFNLKAQSDIDVKNLANEPIEKVLRYNALDAKYTRILCKLQHEEIKEAGVLKTYNEQVRLVATMVLTQLKGINIDQEFVIDIEQKLGERLKNKLNEINKLEDIIKFNSLHKDAFNPLSSHHTTILLRDILKVSTSKKSAKGNVSTDKNVLEDVGGKVGKAIIEYRELIKIKSTYIDNLLATNPDGDIYPDGKVHTTLNSMFTVTNRLSSDGPNIQNQPRKKNKELVRPAFITPEDHYFVAIDYGQIEARVIAMYSKDKVFVKSLWEKYDIHQKWAEKIASKYPLALEYKVKDSDSDKEKMKKLRDRVKNMWVFPSFFGAGKGTVSGYMHIPNTYTNPLFDEFWDEFRGVKQWQKDLDKFYKNHGYVEFLNGRKRHGPLGYSDMINHPIQGLTANLVCDAYNRLSERSQREENPALQPAFMVHDDLSFYIPKSELDESLEIIVRDMLTFDYPFINVPLSVEISVGTNWYDKEEIGTFFSNEI